MTKRIICRSLHGMSTSCAPVTVDSNCHVMQYHDQEAYGKYRRRHQNGGPPSISSQVRDLLICLVRRLIGMDGRP